MPAVTGTVVLLLQVNTPSSDMTTHTPHDATCSCDKSLLVQSMPGKQAREADTAV